ncbi:MAG: RNA polymerase sigma factor [Bifidobacteriaceae bacterium]|nr:RNA polymerase sigma factor [Bifidobacteriaceae bacterium]
MEESDLIAAAASPRDRRFSELFQAHHPRVQAYLLRRTQDREQARDLAAEVFRLAWERALANGQPDPPWLFVTARNLLANARRASDRADRLRLTVAGELTRDPQPHSPGQGDGLADLRERVRVCLDALPEPQREVLMAHYWDDLSGAECAALLGCSTPAVWMRLSRARAAFQSRYSELEDQT